MSEHIPFDIGMKILAAARQALSKPADEPAPAPPHKPVITPEQAHAFQILMLASNQNAQTVGRGHSAATNGLADALLGLGLLGEKGLEGATWLHDQTFSLLHGNPGINDVTPKPGTQVFTPTPGFTPMSPVERLPASPPGRTNSPGSTERYRQESAREDPGSN